MPEPDWDALQRITAEAERLHEADSLGVARFEELLADAQAASNGNPELTESVMLFAPVGYEIG